MGDSPAESTPALLIVLLLIVILLDWLGTTTWFSEAPVAPSPAQAVVAQPVVNQQDNQADQVRVTVGNFAYDDMVSHTFTDMQYVPTHRKD